MSSRGFVAAFVFSTVFAVSYGRHGSLRRTALKSHTLGVESPVEFEVVEKSSITQGETKECLCEQGEFWHWRIKRCIPQGAWGYECGFFPAEHHRFVCADGLVCDEVNGTTVKYFHDGAVPAACRHCNTEDGCTAGAARHNDECIKETTVEGEACATVRVIVQTSASAVASAEHSATATAKETATAEASGEAAGIKVTVTKEATHEASAEKSATAKANVTASAEGVSEAKSCVTVDEVKAELGLKDVAKVGPVLASNIIATGDKMAFDRAYEAAVKAAVAKGKIDAAQAADALAKAKAEADAKMKAQAEAEEAAAWKAEAGASAQAKAAVTDAAQEAQEAANTAAKNVGNVTAGDNGGPADPARPTAAPPTGPPRKMTEKDVRDTQP